MNIVYGYSKCTTVKKALKFLDENNIPYQHLDNVDVKLTKEQIQDLHEKSGLDIKKFFNTSGILYREMNLKNIIPSASIDELYNLLASDGMLVKRPILVTEKGVFPSFRESNWLELI